MSLLREHLSLLNELAGRYEDDVELLTALRRHLGDRHPLVLALLEYPDPVSRHKGLNLEGGQVKGGMQGLGPHGVPGGGPFGWPRPGAGEDPGQGET